MIYLNLIQTKNFHFYLKAPAYDELGSTTNFFNRFFSFQKLSHIPNTAFYSNLIFIVYFANHKIRKLPNGFIGEKISWNKTMKIILIRKSYGFANELNYNN